MPKVGEKEFPYTAQGMQAAAKESSESGIPVSNGATRSESYQIGGKVPGELGFGQKPIVNPRPLGMYEEGGEVPEYKNGGQTRMKRENQEKKREN